MRSRWCATTSSAETSPARTRCGDLVTAPLVHRGGSTRSRAHRLIPISTPPATTSSGRGDQPRPDRLALAEERGREDHAPQRLRRVERRDDRDAPAVERDDQAEVGDAEADAGGQERLERAAHRHRRAVPLRRATSRRRARARRPPSETTVRTSGSSVASSEAQRTSVSRTRRGRRRAREHARRASGSPRAA